MDAEPAGDALSPVLAELTASLGACAGAVLLDAGDGRCRAVCAHGSAAALDGLLDAATRAPDRVGAPRWAGVEGDDDLLLGPIDGQGRVSIALRFAGLGCEGRRAAELALARAAPIAGACVRLWLAAQARAGEVRSLQAALDGAGLGVVLLDAAGEIMFANGAARALLDAGDGLRRVRDRVVTCDLGDTVRLQLAIEHVLGLGDGDVDAAPPLLAIGRAGAPALMLSVLPPGRAPAHAPAGPGEAAAILYVMDPARDMGELLGPVCRAYRLSPAEALLARRLVAGDTVAAAAARMGVKAMTARGYLKQIFLKTDTHRQPELVQLMLSSVIHTHPRRPPGG